MADGSKISIYSAAADQLTERLQKADPRITRLFLRPGRALR